jgi:hypothetical protein
MPNHVYTTVFIDGTEEEIQKFFMTHFNEDDGGDSHFDLETFIKMPEDIGDGWYTWRNHNWGTKWNTYDNHIDHDQNMFSIVTAWNMPEPIFEMMAKMYPTMTFKFEVVEEGGFYSGTMITKDGKLDDSGIVCEDMDTWRKHATEFQGWQFDDDGDMV